MKQSVTLLIDMKQCDQEGGEKKVLRKGWKSPKMFFGGRGGGGGGVTPASPVQPTIFQPKQMLIEHFA